VKTGLISFLLIAGGGVMLYFGAADDFNLGLWLGGIVVVLSGLVAIVVGKSASQATEERRLTATGTAAVGTVTAFRDTGQTMNDSPRVKFDLRITPGDGSPEFDTTKRKYVSRLELPYVGQRFSVRYDPADHTKLILLGPATPTTPSGTPDEPDQLLLRLRQTGAITEDEYTLLMRRISS
jgi:hypothetical protein